MCLSCTWVDISLYCVCVCVLHMSYALESLLNPADYQQEDSWAAQATLNCERKAEGEKVTCITSKSITQTPREAAGLFRLLNETICIYSHLSEVK